MQATEEADKQGTGFSQYLTNTSLPIFQNSAVTLLDSLNWERTPENQMIRIQAGDGTSIGSSLSDSKEQSEEQPLLKSLDHITPNKHLVKQPKSMFGKKIQELAELNLNWAPKHSNATVKSTGMLFGKMPKMETLKRSLQISTSDVTQVSKRLRPSSPDLSQLKEPAMSLLALPEQGKVEERGKKRRLKLIQKAPLRNFGMDIAAKKMSLLMSFVDKSKYLTSYAGLTDIQSLLRLKAVQKFSKQKQFGLHRICYLKIGTQQLMKRQEQHFLEDSKLPALTPAWGCDICNEYCKCEYDEY